MRDVVRNDDFNYSGRACIFRAISVTGHVFNRAVNISSFSRASTILSAEREREYFVQRS